MSDGLSNIYRAAFEHSRSACIIVSADGVISEINSAACSMFGYKADEIPGLKYDQIFETDSDEFLKYCVDGESFECTGIKRNGQRIICECKCSKCEDSDGNKFSLLQAINISLNPEFDEMGNCNHLITIERDVTTKKNQELLKTLKSDVSRVFNESDSLNQTLVSVLELIVKFGDFQLGEIWLVNDDKSSISLASKVDNQNVKLFYEESKWMQSFKKGLGMPGITWQTGNTQFWKNLPDHKNFARGSSVKSTGINTAYCIPIKNKTEVIGSLLLGLSEDQVQERYYTSLLEDLCEDLGSEINRKQLEIQLDRIFSFAPDIICVSGMDGFFKKVNPAMCRLLGYTQDELLNHPISSFTHPDDRIRTEAELDALNINKGAEKFENRYITKDGKVVWLSWTTRTFYDEGKIYSIARDITRQKELKLLLEQANRLSRIGGWEVDLVEYKVIWSDITREIHETGADFKPDMESGISFYKEGDDRETIKEAIKSLINNGTNIDLELQIITAKGNERWVRVIGEADIVEGTCKRLYGSIQDVNQLKTAEIEKNKAARERIEILESISDAFYALDENWKITYFNKEAERLLDVEADDVLGLDFWNIFTQAKETELYDYYLNVKQQKKPATFEYFSLFKNSWFDVSAYPANNGISVYFKNIDERKKGRESLENAYKEKNTILESIGDAFFAVDNEFTITYWNSVAEDMLQLKRSEIVGRNLWETFPVNQDLQFYSQGMRAMNDQVNVNFEEYDPVFKKWFDVYAYPSKNGLSIFVKDITDRKVAESQIVKKNRQLDAIAHFNGLLIKKSKWMDALDECLVLFGEVADCDRVYFFENSVNSDGEKVTSMKVEWTRAGIKPEINNPIHQNLSFQEVQPIYEILSEKKAFNKIVNEIKDSDFRAFLRNQDIQSILSLPVFTGDIFRGFIGFDDCTKETNWNQEEITFLQTIAMNLASAIENEDNKKAFQNAFHDKNQILESIGDCFFTLKKDWTVTYWNRMAEDLIGIKRDEIEGRNLWHIFPDAKDREFYTQYKKVLTKGQQVQFQEYYPGTDMWLEVSAYPSENGMSVFFKDITERKESEKKLKNLNQSLEQQTKKLAASNAELEQFAFVASHDLQEPLRMVTSFLTLLEKKYSGELDAIAKEYIHFATDGAKRMRQIILDLLEFSRIGRSETEKTEVDISLILENVKVLNRKLIEDKVATITWENMPVIYTVKSSTQQLFQNLVNNALNYQKAGNKPVVKIWAEEKEKFWKFYLKDNGIGINSDYTDKIFNIFQRLHGKEEYSGTGVGLAICKKIVEENGGKIGVNSVEGEGSTFYFTIAKNK